VLNFVTGAAADVGPEITEGPAVRAISFTGSTAAGEHIHRSVPFTTRTQMELGGKNPLIVMADADLDKAVDLAVKGGLSLTGQACTGTSRLIVLSPVRKAFTEKLVARIRSMKIGSGMDPVNEIGPLATRKQLDTVLSYVELGRKEATHVFGGERLASGSYEHGWFVAPAVFTDVTQQMRVAREEIFGPVLAIIEANSYEDAIAKANDTEYGCRQRSSRATPLYASLRSGHPVRDGEDQSHHHRQPRQRAVRRPEALRAPRRSASPGAPGLSSTPRSRSSTRESDDENGVQAGIARSARDGARGAREGSRDPGRGDSLRDRRRRLSDRAGAHGRRAHHRPADCVEQGVHGRGHRRSTHLFTTPPNGPRCRATRPSAFN
jgi:hypothetical protein